MRKQDPSHTLYLNHASVALLPTATCDAMTDFLHSRQAPFNYRQTIDHLSATLRDLFARIINADTASISLQPNTATSMSILTNGLNWEAGDEVIIVKNDFPSVSRPFMSLEKKGVKVISLDQAAFYENPVKELTQNISPKTKLFATSWVGYTSGIRIDLSALNAVCKNNDIYFVVDATQGLGALPFSVKDCPVDFLAVSTYKWLMCPLGAAFFYISDALSKHVTPPLTGWLSNTETLPPSGNDAFTFPKTAQKFENGGRPIIPYTGAISSINALLDIGFDTISKQTLTLSKSLSDTLIKMGLELAYNYTDANRSGIIVLSKHPQNTALHQHLLTHNIHTTFRNNHIRFSPYYYQNETDFTQLYTALTHFST